MGLNHIYKVIWSKTKNAWVVVSEIAKRDGKSSVKSVVTSLAGKSVAAVMVAMVMCGGVASATLIQGVGASNSGGGGSHVILGDDAATVGGGGSMVIVGEHARGVGGGAVAIGETAKGTWNTIAIGYHVDASTPGTDGSVVIGANSQASKFRSIVLGYQNDDNGVPAAITSYSSIGGITLNYSNFAGASGNMINIMSVGSLNNHQTSRITNVAPGNIAANSTDAINGSQLYQVIEKIGGGPDTYVHVNDGTGTQSAGNATTNLGKANEKGGATGNRSIAIGVGSQASGQESVVIGSAVKSASDNIVAIGNPAAGSSSIGTNSMGATLIGYNSIISNNSASSSVFGSNSSVLGTSSVAINNASVNGTNSVAINGAAGRFLGINQFTSNNAVAINGVAKGNNNIAIGGSVGYSKVGDSYLVSGSNFSTPSENSIAIGNNTLVTQKNTVMVGTYDKEYTAKANIDKNKVITPALHTAYYTLGAVDKQYYEGTLNNSVYLGHESYAFTPDALVDDESHLTGEQSIHTKKYDATGNIVVSNNTTGGAFGKVSKATINGDEITGFAGAQSVGAVTIGAGDYERRIQNVAAGEVSATSTDGINGSQLYAVANTLSKNMSSYMHINDGTSTQTVGNATTNYGYSGSKAGATGNLAIAGGMNAKASGQQSLSLGSYTKSEGDYSVVIGSSHDTSWSTYGRGQTFALGNYSVVLGRGAQTHKDNSIAIGHRAEVQGEDSIGIGKYVFTGGYGTGLTDSSSGITAVGIKLGVNGKNTNVFGQGNIDNIGGGNPIRANDSTILGNRNGVDSLDSNGQSILPSSINDYATGSHILGNDNQASGNNAIAIGNKIFVYQNSVALGYVAKALGDKSIAVGYGAEARGKESISIGTGNSVLGNKSSAIGDPSYIDTTATGTHVHGNDNGTATNPIKASESTFMGNTNLAGTAGTTGIHVVGNSNSVDSSNVMVMGNNVTVGTGLDGAVVLGHASSADQYAAATDSTINGVTFEAAGYAGNTGLNNGSIVSVGATGTERQIKNVAAGAVTATSTDAINGSQLYKTAETILKMPINMAGDSGDTVGLKLGKTVNIKGSVASGADVTDGNIAVVGDKATSTLSLKMAKNLTGLTSGTFTDATGNQTVINGAGVTVTPTVQVLHQFLLPLVASTLVIKKSKALRRAQPTMQPLTRNKWTMHWLVFPPH